MIIQNRSLRTAVVALFVAVEATLGVLLQTLPGRAADACRFGAIILCCSFCLLFIRNSHAYILTQLALLCTVGADYFLVWSQPRVQLPAMLFFLVAQSAYAVRLHLSDSSLPRRRAQGWSIFALAAIVPLLTGLVLGANTDALAVVSMLYYSVLVINVIFAAIRVRSNPLLAIGLVLFLCCDTVIGLVMMDAYLPIPSDALLYRVIHPGFDLAWACYLPSQVLITLSLLVEKAHRADKNDESRNRRKKAKQV